MTAAVQPALPDFEVTFVRTSGQHVVAKADAAHLRRLVRTAALPGTSGDTRQDLARVLIVLLASITWLVLVSGCGSFATPSTAGSPGPLPSVGPSVIAVLGLYSGRPDPEWTLTTEQAATLDRKLESLPIGTEAPPIGGLGYHGFTIRLPEGTLVAYRGVVAPPGDDPRIVRADPTRSIERYLLETSRPHLTADEFTEVERTLLRS